MSASVGALKGLMEGDEKQLRGERLLQGGVVVCEAMEGVLVGQRVSGTTRTSITQRLPALHGK